MSQHLYLSQDRLNLKRFQRESLLRRCKVDYNEDQKIENQLDFFKKKSKNYILSDIMINKYPYFDLKLDINFFILESIQAKILKSKYYEQVMEIYQFDSYGDFVESACWLVIAILFKKESCKKSTLDLIRKTFQANYSLTFIQIEQPKERFTNIIIFLTAFAVNHLFYNSFKSQRYLFTQQTNLKTYDILLQEIYGFKCSDEYLYKNLTQVFNLQKFFQYQKKTFEQLYEINEQFIEEKRLDKERNEELHNHYNSQSISRISLSRVTIKQPEMTIQFSQLIKKQKELNQQKLNQQLSKNDNSKEDYVLVLYRKLLIQEFTCLINRIDMIDYDQCHKIHDKHLIIEFYKNIKKTSCNVMNKAQHLKWVSKMQKLTKLMNQWILQNPLWFLWQTLQRREKNFLLSIAQQILNRTIINLKQHYIQIQKYYHQIYKDNYQVREVFFKKDFESRMALGANKNSNQVFDYMGRYMIRKGSFRQ